MKKTCILFAIAALAVTARPALPLDLTGGGLYLDSEVDGNVQSNGTLIDVEDDLGLESDETFGGFLRLDGERHHLHFRYTSLDYTGDETITRTIQFQGTTYNIGSRVQSKLEYDRYEFQYHYDLFNFDKFAISPLLKVDIYDAQVNLVDSTNNLNESYDETLPLPSVGLHVRVDPIKYVYVQGQVNGIGYSSSSFIEYTGTVGLAPCRYFIIEAGYNRKDLDFDESDDRIDIQEDAWFVGAGLTLRF